MGKVRKARHQNPEFGHTQGEIFFVKNLQKSTLACIGSITHREHFLSETCGNFFKREISWAAWAAEAFPFKVKFGQIEKKNLIK